MEIRSGTRMVGYELNKLFKNETEKEYPAHRVVNRLGQLTGRGYFPGDSMRERLEQEGVEFTEDYTINIQKHFWDPAERSEEHTSELQSRGHLVCRLLLEK